MESRIRRLPECRGEPRSPPQLGDGIAVDLEDETMRRNADSIEGDQIISRL